MRFLKDQTMNSLMSGSVFVAIRVYLILGISGLAPQPARRIIQNRPRHPKSHNRNPAMTLPSSMKAAQIVAVLVALNRLIQSSKRHMRSTRSLFRSPRVAMFSSKSPPRRIATRTTLRRPGTFQGHDCLKFPLMRELVPLQRSGPMSPRGYSRLAIG